MGWSNLCLVLLLSCVTLINCHAVTHSGSTVVKKPLECSQGQVYWCKTMMTATTCGALKHCIQAVWEREIPIERDNSEVCEVCLDMVKQARDQLKSNQTQEDIKAVLDGSCKLMPIKVVREECLKLMEDFASQIVDVLSSEMNPQVVCSVAGLCNSPRVHELEKEYHNLNQLEKKESKLTCFNCYSLLDVVKEKLESSSTEKMLHFLSELCGDAGSYSDGCMALVQEHIGSIHSLLKQNIQPKPVCSMTGLCKELYHNHNKPLVYQSLSSTTVEVVNSSHLLTASDLPCDLCTQLVVHLKDILVANTTEIEFKLVLVGLCRQMTTYKDQCLNLVNEYYNATYNFLVKELNGTVLCTGMGLCPRKSEAKQLLQPLLPAGILPTTEETPKSISDKNKEFVQLPVERLNPLTIVPASFVFGTNNLEDKSLCAMCEYLLHFVQQEITLPSNEKKIRDVVIKACDRLPQTIAGECESFVQTYMNAFIALLANRIDPSQVCPSLGVCPGDLIYIEYKDKPTCTLCLLAMEEVNRKVKNNTVSEINDVLNNLCLRDEFPNPLSSECVKFIVENRRAIVDMVVSEFTPQESCVYIQSCVAPDLNTRSLVPAGNIETNEISDVEVVSEEVEDSNTCALCEFVLQKLDQELEDKKTHEEIKEIVYKVCSLMPKTLKSKCKDFISQYADLIIELLAQELEPKEICTLMNLCGKASSLIQSPMKRCLLCELMMDGLRTVLTDKNVDDDINKNLEKACGHVPKTEQSLCLSLVRQLAPQIETALRTLPVGPLVCKRIHMCDNIDKEEKHLPLLGGPNCLLGSSYWCRSTTTAAACGNIEYCQEKVWKGSKPKKSHNKGRIVIQY